MPRLVVLASCQSAGVGDDRRSDDGGVLAALGPRLAEAGVPAVLAMQGDVSMATSRRFMPVFFRELQRDGQIDRAMAAARGAVRDRHDWWVPALFMRLRSGRIWYVSGFGQARRAVREVPGAGQRDPQSASARRSSGPGLSDQLLGSRQEIAQRWAKNFRFPMAPHCRDDLPQVAQYLSVNLNRELPARRARQLPAGRAARPSYGDELPDEYRDTRPKDMPLGPADVRRLADPLPRGRDDPYAVLAELPFPLYVTTQPWNLLAEALRAAGKDPQVETVPVEAARRRRPLGRRVRRSTPPDWAFASARTRTGARGRPGRAGRPRCSTANRSYRPDAERPLVYHLFGHMRAPRSLVLTEDDYFDFLIGVTRDKDLVPVGVRRAFADSSLMFLGFRLDEWDFRVLFRSIVNQEGDRRGEHTHVAVQIDPEEGRSIEPERARRYLESYFQSSNITIYWGSTESFVKELRDAWDAEP